MALALDRVTADTFSGHVGTEFELSMGESLPSVTTLVLREVTTSRLITPDRVPFSLVFDGPAYPALEQQIYRLNHAELGAVDIFLVPVAGNAESRQYQAVFS
jgi:hypothetical protein